jgi:hypothetical protein
VGFEPTVAVLERAKTVRALDRAATAIDPSKSWKYFFISILVSDSEVYNFDMSELFTKVDENC